MSDELDRFHQHLDELSSEAGVELDPGDRQRILGASFELEFGPQTTERLFHEIVEADYGDVEEDDSEEETDPDAQLNRHVSDGLDRAEAKAGRRLTEHEREIAANGALRQIDRGEIVDIEAALDDHYAVTREPRADTSSEQGRSEFYRQRLSEDVAPPELPEGTELDMSAPADRATFYEQRLAGVEFEDS